MTAVTFPLRLPRLAFAICGWRWQNDMHEIKYSVVCSVKNKPKKNKGWLRMVNDGHGWSRMVRDGKDGQGWIRLTHMSNDRSQEITEASLNQSTQLSLVPCL